MLTDRQRHNWHLSENAMRALMALNSGNTTSVCDGTPFLTPEERRRLEDTIAWLRTITSEVEAGQRSRHEDHITLHTAAGTSTHQPAAK